MDTKESLQTQKETVMLLAILVRRGGMQSSVIQEMKSVGFSPTRTAELLGTSPNTVNVAIHYAKKSKKIKHEK